MRPVVAPLLLLVACTGEIVTAPPKTVACEQPQRLHRRSGVEYRALVETLVPQWAGLTSLQAPFSQPRRADLFSTWSGQATVTGYDVDDAFAAAEAVTSEWVDRQRELCMGAARTPACLRAVYGPLLGLIESRTAPDDTLRALGEELADAERTLAPKAAATATVRALLMGPGFLFRAELGVEGALQSNELAAALAFGLTERPPDATLRQLADADALTSPEAMQAQARRLLERPAEVPALRRFLRELLQYDGATATLKDRARYPFHRPAELADDTDQVVGRLVAEHARSGLLRALLTSDLVSVRPSTATSWGVTTGADAGVFLSDPTRTGVLTHPAWLVAMSEPDHNHLVRRGRFVRERLLCGEVPMLPGGVVPQIEKTPGLTFRARVEQHSKDPACAGCHRLMDPLGVGFEAWDHLGRAQTMDNGGAVTVDGLLEGAGEVDGPYPDVRALMHRLADSPTVRACWVKQVFRFVRGREVTAADRCELERLTRLYDDSGEDTLAVIEQLFSSPEFLQRRVDTP